MSVIICPVFAQQWGYYTLYAPKNGTQAFLVDTANSPVTYKTWTFSSSARNAYSTYLIPGDTLVRTTNYTASTHPGTGGITGKFQKVTWDGTVAWEYSYSSSTTQMHHDICPLPNGNVLFISYDSRTSSEATQAGSSTASAYWSEKIVEVHQTGPATGEIVWEWKLWDHLCQNYNSSKDNYVSSISDNPQLLNINYAGSGNLPDRWHMNGIDYNEELDQIVVSMHFMNSVFVIDHSTTTAEAAGHTGGNSGKGGDFLYRWGNPASYGASGTTIFNTIHDAHWVSGDNANYPNALAAYNNQGGTGGKTAFDVWQPPYDGYNYSYTSGNAYTPSTYDYQYTSTFTASNEGNSQQLPNGNSLINNFQGSIYEVSPTGTVLWTKTGAQSTHAYRFEKCFVRRITASADASDLVICSGDNTELSASATAITEVNPVFTYVWTSVPAGFNSTDSNPVVSPDETVTYNVIVTNTASGCSDEASVTVTVLPSPAIPEVTLDDNELSCSEAYAYQWYFNGNLIADATNQTYLITENGTYQAEVIAENGCSSMSEEVVFAGLNDFTSVAENDISIFPNPSDGKFMIESNNINFEFYVVNIAGETIFAGKNNTEVDLSSLDNGMYYVNFVSNEKIITRKIIIIK